MRLLLVDGANVVRRYAFAMLGEAQASPTLGSIDGVLRAVERAIRECAALAGCGHAIIALDPEGPTWRHAAYPAYKASRPASGFPWVRTLGEHMGEASWYCAEAPEFEADDTIATLAARAVERGHFPVVLSSDSDLLQLVNPLVTVYAFGGKGEPRFVERPERWIAARFGVHQACEVALYKALVGDPGDDLPGVRGIGPVKAKALLTAYRSAEEICAAGLLNRGAQAQLRLMLSLTTLRRDAPLGVVTPAMCTLPQPGE